jgi:hypothetical protein
MNCKTCNVAHAQFELVDGECIRCVAREREWLRKEHDRLRNDMQAYQNGMTKLATAAGLVTPLELIARAKNNEQTYFDIFADMLRDEFVRKDALAPLTNRLQMS